MHKRLTISLVIPAYNEESYLEACLQSALAQDTAFTEIIVVDNNSTDDTVASASQFAEVKLLHEPRQGVVHARNRGFDAASGDIIARIDADTQLPADWTQQLLRVFEDAQVAAATGKVSYYETALASALSTSDSLLRRSVALMLGKNMALQGANMAIRRGAWQKVRNHICSTGGIHEDFDLAIHAAEQGLKVHYAKNLQATVAFRQAASSWQTFASYYWHCPATYAQHDIRRGRWLIPVSAAMILAYPLLHGLTKAYDARAKRFSIAKLLSSQSRVRVNPATFVD
jgi:glycosyltransferase involved in cell wall biosynthesis